MAENRVQFTFHQCLGMGGFGEVYLATISRPGGLAKRMAVKVLKPDLDHGDEAVMRLRDEGRMLATLNHPAILRAHDLYRVQGRIALATEYVEGIDLARLCKADRLLPQRVVIAVAGEVAEALDNALNAPSPETGRPLRLVHRDIKPENVRLTVHGQVKLLDFGIARTPELVRAAKTRAGDLPFTPGYAAPECFRKGEQGPESDVYALGVTVYRALVGERLYEGMGVGDQFATASLEENYAPFLAARLAKLEAPPPVQKLVRAMLAYEKADRPTAGQVREAAEEIGDRLPGPTLQKWARSVEFPTPKDVKGATLTGLTLFEDEANAPRTKPTGPMRHNVTRLHDPEPRGGSAPPDRTPTPQRTPLGGATPAPAQARPTPTPTPSRPPPPKLDKPTLSAAKASPTPPAVPARATPSATPKPSAPPAAPTYSATTPPSAPPRDVGGISPMGDRTPATRSNPGRSNPGRSNPERSNPERSNPERGGTPRPVPRAPAPRIRPEAPPAGAGRTVLAVGVVVVIAGGMVLASLLALGLAWFGLS